MIFAIEGSEQLDVLTKVDELLLGEEDYYAFTGSEGNYLAVILPELTGPELENRVLELRATLEPLGLRFVEVRKSKPDDWFKGTRAEPFELAEGVIVDPADCTSFERSPGLVLKIPQGLAFGTGLHQTTQMCARLLKKYLAPSMDVLDVGTGTGILAILAKKLGAKRVLAVDNDPIAVEVATENAARNGVDIEVRLSDLFSNVEGRFDLIVSNILAETLLEMLERSRPFLKERTLFILSGIINEKAHLFEDFQILEKMVMDEWTALVVEFR